jgi:hypothetical protein
MRPIAIGHYGDGGPALTSKRGPPALPGWVRIEARRTSQEALSIQYSVRQRQAINCARHVDVSEQQVHCGKCAQKFQGFFRVRRLTTRNRAPLKISTPSMRSWVLHHENRPSSFRRERKNRYQKKGSWASISGGNQDRRPRLTFGGTAHSPDGNSAGPLCVGLLYDGKFHSVNNKR